MVSISHKIISFNQVSRRACRFCSSRISCFYWLFSGPFKFVQDFFYRRLCACSSQESINQPNNQSFDRKLCTSLLMPLRLAAAPVFAAYAALSSWFPSGDWLRQSVPVCIGPHHPGRRVCIDHPPGKGPRVAALRFDVMSGSSCVLHIEALFHHVYIICTSYVVSKTSLLQFLNLKFRNKIAISDPSFKLFMSGFSQKKSSSPAGCLRGCAPRLFPLEDRRGHDYVQGQHYRANCWGFERSRVGSQHHKNHKSSWQPMFVFRILSKVTRAKTNQWFWGIVWKLGCFVALLCKSWRPIIFELVWVPAFRTVSPQAVFPAQYLNQVENFSCDDSKRLACVICVFLLLEEMLTTSLGEAQAESTT